jgi:cytochrome c biogenesis protein CcmG, thiol:disulfide interchange protein DsbE
MRLQAAISLRQTRNPRAGRAVRMLLCVLLLAGFTHAACFAAVTGASLVNKKAPELTRKDMSGNELSLRGLRGKVVLLNFWATWCAPCQLEMPTFVKWQQQYAVQGLQVVGISMDDEAAPARRIATKLKVNYPVAMGDAELGTRYGGVLGLPLTYLIDRNGVVRSRFEGETDPGKIEKQIKLLLQQR